MVGPLQDALTAAVNYGSRLMPQVLDERARSGYAKPFAYIQRSPDPEDGFITVDYATVANGVNRLSWWLDSNISTLVGKDECFAYFGSNDLKYPMLSLACMKTKRKVLLPSLRNTVAAQKILFERTNCKAIIYEKAVEKSLEPLFSAVRSQSSMQIFEVIGLDEILSAEPVTQYDFSYSFEEIKHKVFLVLHSSGSSGSPKPIEWTHEFMGILDNGHSIPSDEGKTIQKDELSGQNILCLLPLFHAGGHSQSLLVIWYESPLVFTHPAAVPTAEYFNSLLSQGLATTFLTPPSILEDISKLPNGIETLSKLDHIAYCGGPLSPRVGNQLAPRMNHLYSLIGMTEYGWLHQISSDSSKWRQIKLYSKVGYRFEQAANGMYELIFPHHSEFDKWHGTNLTFPNLPEYRTRDMYMKSPEDDGWWTYCGRVDDLIVLSNGEKINPIPQEQIINSHPLVKAALVVGEYQFLPSVLIEAHQAPTTDAEEIALREQIWPTVEEANKLAPRFSRIPQSLIIFVPPEKAFYRAGKGTVQRWLTVEHFKSQLDAAYISAQQGLLSEGISIENSRHKDSIQSMLVTLYSRILKMTPDVTDDVFERGMDSLQVAILTQQIRATLRANNVAIDPARVNHSFIYANPTISRLADALHKLIVGDPSVNNITSNATQYNSTARLQQLIDKYSLDSLITPVKAADFSKGLKVILTGSTGSFGSYLLDALLSEPSDKIPKIFCLNRSQDSGSRQKTINASRGLKTTWEAENGSSRVEFLTVDLSQSSLGLEATTYSELAQEANMIIHCGWKVDFNLSVESFEKSNIAGVHHLLNLSSISGAPLFFVSSVSIATNLLTREVNQLIPESIISDLSAPELGYGESKYIGERLISNANAAAAAASASSSLPNIVLRVGQIAGPVLPGTNNSGQWNKNEWFPSLLMSSKYLGMLPDSLGHFSAIDFIPIDILARITIEILFATASAATTPSSISSSSPSSSSSSSSSSTHSNEVYNLTNPAVTSWTTLLPMVQSHLSHSAKKPISIVPLSSWVTALEKSATDYHGAVVETNPAVKLLDWFRGLDQRKPTAPGAVGTSSTAEQAMVSRWKTANLTRDSISAQKLKSVDGEWLDMWLRQLKL